jgi:trehalose/maltose hydrolase-like predicted phosphorylase
MLTSVRKSGDRTPAYVANGLVGLRVGPVPLAGTALLNGYVHRGSDIGMETAAPLPYPLALVIAVDGVSTRKTPEAAGAASQQYDFAAGELVSRFTVRGREATAEIETVTFCSRSEPTLALQRTTLRVDRPCRVVFAPEVNPEGLPGRVLERAMPDSLADLVLHLEGEGGLSSCGIAVHCRFSGGEVVADSRNGWGFERGVLARQIGFQAQPGGEYALEQIAACVPSVLHSQPHWQAVRHVREGVVKGFDRLRADNRAVWAELWRGRILIDADGPWQDVADAAFFYGHSSAHAASPLSVAPFGLSAPFYYGHVFWDCETFLFPFLLLTAPETARAILDYRSQRLTPARNLARLLGQRGLCFPWQSGLAGDEVTPLPYVQMQERHINTDIAFAFAQYAHATGDDLFTRQQAWPVLQGVADWIDGAVVRTGRGFELRGVSGIDESREDVNNDSYTNMSASVVLREAAAMAERVGLHPPGRWREIAASLALARDAASGAILNYDGFAISQADAGHWSACPETLAGFFPMVYRADPATEAATYRYYFAHISRSQGMPMLSTLTPTWAVRTGDRESARSMLESGVLPFLREPFMMFSELGKGVGGFSGDDTTCFMATLGGYLLTCLYGFTGIQLDAGDPREWGKFPVTLPEGWRSISVERLWIHGRPASLLAEHGQQRARIDMKEQTMNRKLGETPASRPAVEEPRGK